MFLDIFNWMLAHVPGFVRPAVNWLLEGLRSITNYLSQRWNALGRAVVRWLTGLIFWGATVIRLAGKLADFAYWVVFIRIPAVVGQGLDALGRAMSAGLTAVRDFLLGVISGVKSVFQAAIDWLGARLSDLGTFVQDWINWLYSTVTALIHALSHVLNGPEVLAQWLVASMWKASLRFLRSQQDRIALWLTRESVAFTRWLTTELENIIMRWL